MLSIDRSRRIHRGFSLIEILVIIGIIGILAGLAIPKLVKGREKAYRAQSMSNLKAIQLALAMYHSIEDAYPMRDDWQKILLDQGYLKESALDVPGRTSEGEEYAYYLNVDWGYIVHDVSYGLWLTPFGVTDVEPPIEGTISQVDDYFADPKDEEG